MLVLKGIEGGSLKITSEIKIIFKAKNNLKRFLGVISIRGDQIAGISHGSMLEGVQLALSSRAICDLKFSSWKKVCKLGRFPNQGVSHFSGEVGEP